MKDIAIYGAGGFGREITLLINGINYSLPEEERWNLVGFFDDGKKIGEPVSHYGCVLGGIGELNSYDKPLAIALAMGDPVSLKKIRESITNLNISFPNLIAPDFYYGDRETFKIGEGNIIGYHCSVTVNGSIGSYNILNSFVVAGHDVSIGDYNVFMPDIRISGAVTIGDRNLFGTGSIILQQIKIGDDVHLGAGAVLMTKPKDGNTYIGNPAKLFKY